MSLLQQDLQHCWWMNDSGVEIEPFPAGGWVQPGAARLANAMVADVRLGWLPWARLIRGGTG